MSCTDLEEFQKVWQAQDGAPLDADLLMETLQRHDQSFRRTIFWRDAREIGVALALIPVWTWLGIAQRSPWTWWLGIPGLLWVAGFMFVDRRRQLRAAPPAGASLRVGIAGSLAHVEHQIWLLRNVLWWYLLPLGIPLALFFVQLAIPTGRQDPFPLWQAIVAAAVPLGFLIGLYGFIYWLNQYAVRKLLEPLRERLQSALAALTDNEPAAS
jgi:hypothetical protein